MDRENLPSNLPVSVVAEYLNICASTVYDMVRRKQIPSFRIGQRVIIPREMFFAWVEEKSRVVE